MDANTGTHRRGRERRGLGLLSSVTRYAVAALLVGLALAACSGSDGATGDEAAARPTSPAVPPGPSDIASPWSGRFSEQEIATYEAALARWQEYSDKTARIYRAGRDTPAARAVFREYDMQAAARIRSLAETYEAGGLRTLQGPEALSAEPVSVDRRVVLISQCNDYLQVQVTRAGEPVAGIKPKHLQTPILIEMDRAPGHDWMVARVQLKDRKSCRG